MRIEIEYPGARKDAAPNVTRFIRPAPGRNFIPFNRFEADSAEALIAAQLAFFAPHRPA